MSSDYVRVLLAWNRKVFRLQMKTESDDVGVILMAVHSLASLMSYYDALHCSIVLLLTLRLLLCC